MGLPQNKIFGEGETKVKFKTTLKSSVAAAALFAIAAPMAPSANAADDTLKSGNKNSLTISGYVAKSLMYADDGYSDSLFITDGSTSRSRVRWVAKGTLNENVTAGAMIEMDIPLSNQRNAMTLQAASGTPVGSADGTESAYTTSWGERHQFVWVNHKKMGKISLGNTNAASNGRSETTFSGTNMTDTSGMSNWGGGIAFLDITNGAASPCVSSVPPANAFTNLDGRSRTDVLRYDTPRFAGLALATSYIAGGDWDIGADYRAKFGGVKVRIQGQYNNSGATSTSVRSSASFSATALHDSGVNATIAYGEQDLQTLSRDNPNFVYFNVGYKAKIFGIGGTNFSVGWNRTSELVANNTESTGVSVTVAQIISPIGANMILSYRNYSYDTSTATFEDIDVIALGTVFNF